MGLKLSSTDQRWAEELADASSTADQHHSNMYLNQKPPTPSFINICNVSHIIICALFTNCCVYLQVFDYFGLYYLEISKNNILLTLSLSCATLVVFNIYMCGVKKNIICLSLCKINSYIVTNHNPPFFFFFLII